MYECVSISNDGVPLMLIIPYGQQDKIICIKCIFIAKLWKSSRFFFQRRDNNTNKHRLITLRFLPLVWSLHCEMLYEYVNHALSRICDGFERFMQNDWVISIRCGLYRCKLYVCCRKTDNYWCWLRSRSQSHNPNHTQAAAKLLLKMKWIIIIKTIRNLWIMCYCPTLANLLHAYGVYSFLCNCYRFYYYSSSARKPKKRTSAGEMCNRATWL